MPWLNKKKEEELPPELKGKTQEEIVAAVKKAEALEAEVTSLKSQATDRDKAVTGIQTQFEEIKARLAAAEANPRPQNQQVNTDEPPANFIEEPDKAFGQRIAPLANLTVQNARMTAKILAQQSLDNQDAGQKTMNGRLFRHFDAELETESKKYPAQNMITPDAWLGLFWMIKGRHSDEISNTETRKKNYSFLEPTVQNVAQPDNKPKTGVDSLTDQEKDIARKMGKTPEEYAKRKAQMQFVSA